MNINEFKILLYRYFEVFFGRNITRKVNLKLSLKKYKKSKCVFIHIPKAGGTSVANAVLGKTAGHFTALDICKEFGREKYDEFFSFTVTRNPYQRLRSSYYYIKNQGGNKGGVRRDKEFEKEEFSSFERFVREWLVRQDMEQVNLLFKPQFYFVCDDKGDILVDHLGKIEELFKTEKIVEKTLGNRIDIGEKNKGSYRREYDYDQDIKDIIYLKYKKDFEIFNYDK